MQLIILSDEILKEELLSNGIEPEVTIHWIHSPEQLFEIKNADGLIDLLFDYSDKRIELLKPFPGTIIINSVEKTLTDLNSPFVRINGWPTFLKRNIVEASLTNDSQKQQAEKIFQAFNKKIEWLPDEPGFVSAKVVAMIINEAWFAMNEGVSSKEDIDTAMKLGTNYPYGPLEWCAKIGEEKILALLNELAKKNPRYIPAKFLEKPALK
jgi:3-hydroxybutyryl-CoA dehydrogenase